jgi:hypothetical protein
MKRHIRSCIALAALASASAFGQVVGPVVTGKLEGQTLISSIPFSTGAGASAVISTQQYVDSKLPLAGATGSIGGGALALGTCATGTSSISGAQIGMTAYANPSTYPGDGMWWDAYVSAPGMVTVKVCAAVAGAPPASAYSVRVIQ